MVTELTCPTCGLTAEREVQFKHRSCAMEQFHIGDFVLGAPAGQPLLPGSYSCPGPAKASADHRQDVWVHVDRGFLTAVTHERPARPAQVAWWMIERAATDAAGRKRALRNIRNTVRARRRTLEEGQLPEGEEEGRASLTWVWQVESEAELLDRLEEHLEASEQRDWPGGSSGSSV